jgi:flagellar assembly protein FliH
MSSSRIIRGNEALEASRWDAPAVDVSAAAELKGAGGRGAHLLTARQLDDLQRQVHKEAHERGFEQGLADGRAEVGKRVARLEALIAALAAPFEDLDESVERALVDLAIVIAGHLVRRELADDPAELAHAVHECLETLPIAARDVTVYLHPDDLAVVTAELGEDAERAWKLAPDRGLARADVRVQTPSSRIDGSVEKRLAEIVANAVAQPGAPEAP